MKSDPHDWQRALKEFLEAAKRPLVVVLGPTASGKTEFSLKIAALVQADLGKQVEVVNADSRQLYGFLNIGTAKITEEEKQGMPHHLLNVLDPKEEVTVAWYKEQAEKTIDAILERGHVPLLVGGSMLYISAIIDGLTFASQSDPALRKRLEEEYEVDGGVSLYERLKEVDPETAASVHPRNKPYLIRALEIIESTGEPASSQKGKSECPYDLLIFGMDWPREELHERINERTKAMLRSGWIEEVQGLLEKGYSTDDPAMKSHGYWEIVEKLQEGAEPELLKNGPELSELIASRSRQYAKRQLTWWRRDERILWLKPVSPD